MTKIFEMSEFEKEFKNPPSTFRGAPFWAWNGKITKEVVKERIDDFSKMGFGGFHIHSRIGLKTPYLSDEFMELVKFCNEYGKEKGMFTYLYDEDKWPSGYGGGFVTENEDFRARYLLFSNTFYPNGHLDRQLPPKGRLTENGTIKLLAKYSVTLKDGMLVSYKKTEGDTNKTWYAYEVIGDKLPWFNNSAYVDVLNPKAIKEFIKVTYEKYKEYVGEEFSKSIPSIFTDEPQYIKMQHLEDGEKGGEASIAYTTGMDEAFFDKYGYRFFEKLPELFWERADGTLSAMKYHYYNFLSDRFAESYSKTLGDWCKENNIKLTGHLMYEDTLETQSQCVGDAMRSYPHFGIPGIDVLAGFELFNTAKQAQSVAHQYGKTDVSSELYGVTNWDYDFSSHKLHGDWQAALGITLRVPHLSWSFMGGEAKRDYPSPIDSHTTWHEKYNVIENHFARVNTALRRGKPKVNVCVIHPIESYWLLTGAKKQTMQKRMLMDKHFEELTNSLLFGLIDFDFLSEGLLPSQEVKIENGKLFVGKMAYSAVVVPKLLTIRKTTLDILDEFKRAGGKILSLGPAPDYIDAKPSRLAHLMLPISIGFDCDRLLSELEPYRDIDIKTTLSARPDYLIYQMREEQDIKWVFVAHGKKEENIESGAFKQYAEPKAEFIFSGEYTVELFDTETGISEQYFTEYKSGKTVLTLPCHEHDSFLFRLTPKGTHIVSFRISPQYQPPFKEFYLPSSNKYKLDEANTLLLDMPEWSLDGEEFNHKEEILRIDNEVRKRLCMHLRTDSFPQPWLTQESIAKEHTVTLRFKINSKISLPFVSFAFEGDSDVKVSWNGKEKLWNNDTWFIDRDINKILLGGLNEGENELILTIPFGENTNLEWCYLLGNFGVHLCGNTAEIISLPEKLGFGDYAVQGLAFYGGSVVYETEIETEETSACEIVIPHFNAPLISVSIDSKEEIPVYKAPYTARFNHISKGKHTVKIRAYGSRINQFGQVHNCNERERYFGPKTWRTEGVKWCYEYNLKKCGVLTAPIVKLYH